MRLSVKYVVVTALFVFFLNAGSVAQKNLIQDYSLREQDSLQNLFQQSQIKGFQNKRPAVTSDYVLKYPGGQINPNLKNLEKQSSACFDSSGRFFLRKDSTNFYVGDTYQMSDGNLLISGQYYSYSHRA